MNRDGQKPDERMDGDDRPGRSLRRREKARHFAHDYDMNRGRFDPDYDLNHEYMKEDFGPGYGKHRHDFDQPEESERRFRRTGQSAFFSEDNSDLNRRGFYGKGPKGWSRDDNEIREDVCEALHDDWHVDASEIEVKVEEGCLILTGTVDSRATRRAAEQCGEKIRGVTDIRNELQIRKAS